MWRFNHIRTTVVHTHPADCLASGRLHQIRAHMAAKGFPIVGDMIYGAATWAMWPWCKRLFLHCWRLRLFGFDGPIQLKAELPQELKDALGALEIQTIQTEDTEVLEAMGETMHQAMRDILDQRELGTGNDGDDDTPRCQRSPTRGRLSRPWFSVKRCTRRRSWRN